MKKIVLVVLMCMPMSVFASKWCSGQVHKIWINNLSNVYLVAEWAPSKNYQICKLSQTWKNVSPEACKGWLASAQLAYASKEKVVMMYGSGSDAYDCAGMPNYESAPGAYYLMLDQGS